MDTYYNGGIYSAYLRKFVFCLDFYLNKCLRMEKQSEGKKWNKLMEYLKEFIVDIYYNGGIYSVHLRKCFSYFYLLLADGKNIYLWEKEKEKN